MAFLYTGDRGIPLREIIEKLGNKNYPYIETRCKYTDLDGIARDEFFGTCSYKDGDLTELDHDTYSLDDLYIEWEEWTNEDGELCLTLWENGELSTDWRPEW